MKKLNLKTAFCLSFFLIILSVGQAVFGQRNYLFTGADPMNPTNWFSTSNWGCDMPPCTFPGADDNAQIGIRQMNNSYTVFSPRALGAASVKDLSILNGSTLNFTNFTTTGTFNLGDLPFSTARLEAIGSGAVFHNNGTMNIVSQTANSTFSGNFTFFNNGTVNLWRLNMVGSPGIVNQPNAAIFIHGIGLVGGGVYTFNNLGNLSKPSSVGTGIVSFANLTNSGSIEVGSGTLEIGGGGSTVTSNCGRFTTLNSGAVLLLLAGLTVNECASVAPSGNVAANMFGPGPIRVQSNVTLNGGELEFGFRHPTSGQVTGGNVEFQSDSISGTGNLRIVADANTPSFFKWITGTIGGSGTFDIETGGTFNVSPSTSGVTMNSRIFNNAGTFVWTAGNIGNSLGGLTFNNQPTGVFDARSDGSFSSNFAGNPLFNNSGTFRKTNSSGTTNINLVFNNSGIVEAQSGTLRFSQTSPNPNTFGGIFNIAGGAFVEFGTGSHNFNAGLNFTGAGTARAGANSNISVTAPVAATNFEIDGGTVRGPAGTNNTRFTVSGGSSTFRSGFFQDLELFVLRGALISLGQNLINFRNAKVTNHGTMHFYLNTNLVGTSLFNFGTTEAQHNASLRQNAGHPFVLFNSGFIKPGAPVGTLFMDGNFTQNPTGALNIEIGGTTPGTQHDQFRIFAGAAPGTGTATLGGTVNVNLVNGFTPSAGQFFQIMTCQTGCNGQFQRIIVPNLTGGNVLIPGYGTNAVSIITATANPAINPPTLSEVENVFFTSIVRGTYNGAPNTEYLISFYRGCGQTDNNFGTKIVTTDANGFVKFSHFSTFRLVGTTVSARAVDSLNQVSNSSNCLRLPGVAVYDFDDDLKTDISIFRPNDNFSEFVPGLSEWWYQRSSDGQVFAVQFGAPTDKITPGDFTGDGKTDIAFWRPSNGFWFILRSEDNSFFSFPFGANGDIPAPADYDGDGKTDVAVFRPSNNVWYTLRSSDGAVNFTLFGTAGDKPVVADYDGDGKSDIAIFRPSVAEWWIKRSSDNQVFAAQFGSSGDRAVPSDYTGDGKADIAFWRPPTGEWFVLRSEDNSFYAFPFGSLGDIPAPGDYDGDGKTDATVFRPSNGTWYSNRSTAGLLIVGFGLQGDTPLPSAYVH